MKNYYSKLVFLALLSISTSVNAESYCKGHASLWLNDIMWQYDLKSTCKNSRNNSIWEQAPGFLLIKPSERSMQNARNRFLKSHENQGYKLIAASVDDFIFEFNSAEHKKADYCFIETKSIGYNVIRYSLHCLDSVPDKLDIYKNGTEFINQGPDMKLEPELIKNGFYKSGTLDSDKWVFKRIIK